MGRRSLLHQAAPYPRHVAHGGGAANGGRAREVHEELPRAALTRDRRKRRGRLMVKIVHAADLHLDSPLRGLDRYEGAPAARMRGATRKALENLVDACLAEEVDLLLLAGDLYDGNWKDYGTGLFFAHQMLRLRAAKIPVVMLKGNHDAASQITKG